MSGFVILIIETLLGFLLCYASFAELSYGWKINSPLLYKLRPTLFRTTRIYKAKPKQIFGIDFKNLDEIFVSIDRPSMMIFFRRKLFIRIFELNSLLSFWGTIKLTDHGDSSKAIYVGKPPFSSLCCIACFFAIFVLILNHTNNPDVIFFLWLLFPIFILMLIISYIFEKRRFVRHISDIENLLYINGVFPERDSMGG